MGLYLNLNNGKVSGITNATKPKDAVNLRQLRSLFGKNVGNELSFDSNGTVNPVDIKINGDAALLVQSTGAFNSYFPNYGAIGTSTPGGTFAFSLYNTAPSVQTGTSNRFAIRHFGEILRMGFYYHNGKDKLTINTEGDVAVGGDADTQYRLAVYKSGSSIPSVSVQSDGIFYTAGGRRVYTISATGNIGLSKNSEFVSADASSSNLSLSLPAVSTQDEGLVISIVKIDSSANTVTINAGSSTINGASSHVLSSQYEGVTVVYAGSSKGWIIRP